MTEASRHLVTLAERIAGAYVSHTPAVAILLTGSASLGESDTYSDLDLIVYHAELPSEAELAASRAAVGVVGAPRVIGDRSEGEFMEAYPVQGVECQLGHTTVDVWERDLARVLVAFDATTPLQKAVDGLLLGKALHGAELIARWRERARAYPDGLARAMIQTHLRFFPIWRLYDRLQTRDATIWYFQILVESAQNLLAVLAGLNRLYFSTFQFKRLRELVARMEIAPTDLADRLDGLFRAVPATAVVDLKRLVAETLDLIQAHFPEVDVTKVRQTLGTRDHPWTLPGP